MTACRCIKRGRIREFTHYPANRYNTQWRPAREAQFTDIALSPETQRLLEEKVRSGQYGSADDVVQAALQALDELHAHGLDEATLDAIDRAEDEIERGEVHDWRDVREHVKAKFLGN